MDSGIGFNCLCYLDCLGRVHEILSGKSFILVCTIIFRHLVKIRFELLLIGVNDNYSRKATQQIPPSAPSGSLHEETFQL